MIDNDSPRILITRLSHIGDCIHAFPLAHALRERFPKSFIAWVVERPADQLLRLHPALDKVIVLPRRWYHRASEVVRAVRELRPLGIDVSIDPQSLSKKAFVGRACGARKRIGFARPAGRELAPLLNNVRVAPNATHVVDRYMELLSPLGIVGAPAKFSLAADPAAARTVGRFLSANRLESGFAVINPGAGWASRLWPAERFGMTARHLGEAHELPIVVTWAGEQEKEWAEEIVSRSAGHAIIAPPTNLAELAGLLRKARLFVGSDTGPLHLAAAVGAPCVSLHGATLAEVSGPYGPQHITVQHHYQGRAGRKRRGAANEAMLAIDVEAVCSACDAILARSNIPVGHAA
jgi:lipopolysaccharide heptosyltransferase I